MTENLKDFVDAAVNQRPVEAAETFDSIMRDKLTDMLDVKRVEVAQSMFNPSQDEE